MKRMFCLITILTLLFSFGVVANAEDTTDYTFKETEVIDFCVYNTWGVKSVDCDVTTVKSIELTVDITDYSGDPVTLKLYNRESTTWGWWTSEPQTISRNGTYVFRIDLDANAYDSATLCSIYLKDVACAAKDEDPSNGGEKEASGVTCRIKMTSCKFNTDPVSTEGTETTPPSSTPANTPANTTTNSSSNSSNDNTNIGMYVIIFIIIVIAIVLVGILYKKKKSAK